MTSRKRPEEQQKRGPKGARQAVDAADFIVAAKVASFAQAVNCSVAEAARVLADVGGPFSFQQEVDGVAVTTICGPVCGLTADSMARVVRRFEARLADASGVGSADQLQQIVNDWHRR